MKSEIIINKRSEKWEVKEKRSEIQVVWYCAANIQVAYSKIAYLAKQMQVSSFATTKPNTTVKCYRYIESMAFASTQQASSNESMIHEKLKWLVVKAQCKWIFRSMSDATGFSSKLQAGRHVMEDQSVAAAPERPLLCWLSGGEAQGSWIWARNTGQQLHDWFKTNTARIGSRESQK